MSELESKNKSSDETAAAPASEVGEGGVTESGAGEGAPVEPGGEAGKEEEESGRRLAIRTLGSIVLLFVLVGVGALLFKDELQAAGEWFVAQFGLVGIFLGVLLSDTFGVPIPPDTYLVAAVTGGADPVPVLVVVCIASVLGGNLAYLIGSKAGQWPLVRRIMERWRPKGERLFAKWGISAVTVAAWTPVPFMVVCFFAGMFKMPYRRLFLATLHRIPRHIVYYLVIAAGWIAGG